ncbi:hypothetical protein ABLO16_04605, partial [Mycobacterium tuberculosis]
PPALRSDLSRWVFNLNQEGKQRCFRIYRETLSRFRAPASILPTSTRTGAGMGSWSEPPETARLIGFHGEATAAEMDNVDRLPGLTAIRL